MRIVRLDFSTPAPYAVVVDDDTGHQGRVELEPFGSAELAKDMVQAFGRVPEGEMLTKAEAEQLDALRADFEASKKRAYEKEHQRGQDQVALQRTMRGLVAKERASRLAAYVRGLAR